MMNLVSIEPNPIKSLDIYLSTAKYHIFSSKIVESSIPLLTSTIAVTVHHTNHPIHTLGPLPFAILNEKQSIGQERLEKLIGSIIGMNGEGGSHKEMEIVNGIWSICKELCAVSSVFAQQDINPYWMFISPWFKYKSHRQLSTMKEQLILKTDYLQTDGSLHIDNLLIKLSTLAQLYRTLPLATYPPIIQYFLHLIFQSMLLHFKANSNNIYQAALADARFNLVQQNVREMAARMREQGWISNKIVTYLNIDLKIDELKRDPYPQSYNDKIGRALFKPICSTGLFMLVYFLFG